MSDDSGLNFAAALSVFHRRLLAVSSLDCFSSAAPLIQDVTQHQEGSERGRSHTRNSGGPTLAAFPLDYRPALSLSLSLTRTHTSALQSSVQSINRLSHACRRLRGFPGTPSRLYISDMIPERGRRRGGVGGGGLDVLNAGQTGHRHTHPVGGTPAAGSFVVWALQTCCKAQNGLVTSHHFLKDESKIFLLLLLTLLLLPEANIPIKFHKSRAVLSVLPAHFNLPLNGRKMEKLTGPHPE